MRLLAANNINIEGALEGTNFSQAGGYTVPNMIITLINILLIAAGVGAFVFLLWGALDWILAGGAKEGAENARKKITGSLIGLSIVFSVYVIQSIIGIVFLGDGNAIFNFNIPTLDRIAVPPAPIIPKRPPYSIESPSSDPGVAAGGAGSAGGTGQCQGTPMADIGTYSRSDPLNHRDSFSNCYKCLAAFSPCVPGNTGIFPNAFWCPVELLGPAEVTANHCR
ncbi:MAG: hypothetical protein AAB906_03495, partial [Patescibacteria group bacterium]